MYFGKRGIINVYDSRRFSGSPGGGRVEMTSKSPEGLELGPSPCGWWSRREKTGTILVVELDSFFFLLIKRERWIESCGEDNRLLSVIQVGVTG